jgi:hypothetical protein
MDATGGALRAHRVSKQQTGEALHEVHGRLGKLRESRKIPFVKFFTKGRLNNL